MNANDTERRSRRWLVRGIFALLLLGAAVFVFRNAIFGRPVEVYTVTRGDLVQTVVASGRVTTPQRVSIGAVITGRVSRIPVAEGQQVQRGDVLIELDDRDERAALAQANAAVAQSEAKLRQLRDVAVPAAEQALVQAQANAVNARQQHARAQELREKGFQSQAAVDEARRNLDVAESQLKAAHLQVETNRPGGSDYRLAQTALDQARASVAAAQAKLDKTVIAAPVGGVLIGRSVEPGDTVQPGRELMALAPAGETQIVVQIDERNLSKLAVGQQAFASADAFPGRRFAAELFYINPGIDPQRGAVEVKLRVPDPPDYLRQDMTVSVDIAVARSADTLTAPADAVHDSGGAAPWVLAVQGRRAVRVPVKVGLRGDGRVEIVAGAAAGDRLVPVSNPGVKAGSRVRVAGNAGEAKK